MYGCLLVSPSVSLDTSVYQQRHQVCIDAYPRSLPSAQELATDIRCPRGAPPAPVVAVYAIKSNPSNRIITTAITTIDRLAAGHSSMIFDVRIAVERARRDKLWNSHLYISSDSSRQRLFFCFTMSNHLIIRSSCSVSIISSVPDQARQQRSRRP